MRDSRTWLAALFLFGTSFSISGTAWAEEDVPPPSDQAREWYESGADLYARGEFDAALDAFRRAFTLVPRPQLHFNMAQCLSRMGRHLEAVSEFQLAVDSAELSDEERRRARAELLVARAELGHLRIAGEGSASVDGESCTLPCEIDLDPGEHTVVFEGRERRVTLERGRERELTLVATAITAPLIEPPRRGYRPGVGTIVGASLIALGAGGAIGFGLRTNALADDFDRNPSDALADDGEQAKLLANLSIGIAVTGALIWLTEILVGSLRREAAVEEVSSRPVPSAW